MATFSGKRVHFRNWPNLSGIGRVEALRECWVGLQAGGGDRQGSVRWRTDGGGRSAQLRATVRVAKGVARWRRPVF